MSSDGTNSYYWNARNELVTIVYPGTGNLSEFTYDALDRLAKIVEKSANVITSTQQFVQLGPQKCEERDAGGTIAKQFFSRGEKIASSSYFVTRDSLGSVREYTNSSSVIQAQYKYDPFGRPTVEGSDNSSFGYGSYYRHTPSNLLVTSLRCYNSIIGRFISRDLMGESAGVNMYTYVTNNPTNFVDPDGLQNMDLNAGPHTIWYRSEQFAALIGAPAGVFKNGCVDVARFYMGLPLPGSIGFGFPGHFQTLPEQAIGTNKKCWWGGKNGDVWPAASKACKYKCPDGTKKVIWCKQGVLAPGVSPGERGSDLSNMSMSMMWHYGTSGSACGQRALFSPTLSTVRAQFLELCHLRTRYR